MTLEGTDAPAAFEGRNLLPGVSHYALQHDPARWLYDVPHYESVLAHHVYSGIDLRYRGHNGTIEFDFEIEPNADASAIRMRFNGEIHITPDGDLIAQGTTLRRPAACQTIQGRRKTIDARFRILGDHVAGVKLGPHDSREPLTIDPVIDFATFLGGSNNEFDTQVTTDASGNIYMAGTTYSADFPGAPQAGTQPPVYPANPDVYVTRLKPDASAEDWSITIGGSLQNRCMAIAKDALGNIYVLGSTTSPDFPVTPGAWKSAVAVAVTGTNDEFVLKLSAATGHIAAATYLGLSGAGPFAVDASGGVYVASSSPASTFQATPGAYLTQGHFSNYDYTNPVLIRLNKSLTAVSYATYIDLGSVAALQVDDANEAVFSGIRIQEDIWDPFPATNPIPGVNQSGAGPYVAKLNSAGSGLVHASMIDGNDSLLPEVDDLMLDPNGNIYITGSSTDSQFPQVNPVTIDPLPPGYPAPGGVYPSPFIAVVPPQGGSFLRSTWFYGPEYSTDRATGIWSRFAMAGNRVCVTGVGLANFEQTPGGLVANVSSTGPGAGSTLYCIDATGSYFEIKTQLPYTGSGYTSLAQTPDGALLFAGVTNGILNPTPGVVQQVFGGEYLSYTSNTGDPVGDAFLYRVSLPNPPPSISYIDPDSCILAGQGCSFTLIGSGFGSGMGVTVNGIPVTVEIASSSQAAISVANGALHTGSNSVVASIGAPRGGVSEPAEVTCYNPVPGSVSISPAFVTAGSGPTLVTVTASYLSPASSIVWDEVQRPADFVVNPAGTGTLQVLLTQAELAAPSSASVAVFNAGPGGGTSPVTWFSVRPPSGESPPIFTPSYVLSQANRTASTLPVEGSGFDSTTKLYWDGTEIPVTVNSATEVVVTPPPGSLGSPGAHTVYATNGPLVSNSLRVYVSQSYTGIRQAVDPVRRRLYSVDARSSPNGYAFALLIYDIVSGAQIGIYPDLMEGPAGSVEIAVSDDGQFVYLYCGASGTQIVRFNTVPGVVDLNWQVPLPTTWSRGSILAVFAAGSPQTLEVILQGTLASPRGGYGSAAAIQTLIYDGSKPRPRTQEDAGIQLGFLRDSDFYTPTPVFGTQNRIIFRDEFAFPVCWQWLDFDGNGIEGGSSVCGPEPAELVHDHGVSYLTDGNRSLAVDFPAGGNFGYLPVFLTDPVHRMAWALAYGTLTSLNLDTLQQAVWPVPVSPSGGNGLLYLTSQGVLMLEGNLFMPVP